MSAALFAYFAEGPETVGEGRTFVPSLVGPPRDPPVVRPTGGIGLVVGAVTALGPECSRDAIVRKAGLAATTTDILLAAAVDTGLVARARFGRNFLYSPARSQP